MKDNKYIKVLYALKHENYSLLIHALQPLLLKNVKVFPRDMQSDILQEYTIICIQLAKILLQESHSKRKVK